MRLPSPRHAEERKMCSCKERLGGKRLGKEPPGTGLEIFDENPSMFFCPLSLQRDLLSIDIDNLMREFQPCIKHDRYKVSHPTADYRRSKFMYSVYPRSSMCQLPMRLEKEGESILSSPSSWSSLSPFSSTLSFLSLLPHTPPPSPFSPTPFLPLPYLLHALPSPPTQPQNCGGLLCD